MGANISLCQTQGSEVQSEITIEELQFDGNFQRWESYLKLPPISQELSDLLAIKRPFHRELNSIQKPKKVYYKTGTYVGETSKFIVPSGWGKLYCEDGKVIIGQFSNGSPKGKFFCANPNGTYYKGQIDDGKLTCQHGLYYSTDFQYFGGFKSNLYHGKGRILKEDFVLEGDFFEGKISVGKLQWKENGQDYIYIGQFNDEMKMHGKGVLEDPLGIYRGEFKNNKKQGSGEYQYINQNRFKGQYVDGLKHGYGELCSRFNQIVYKGEWEGDVPIDSVGSLINSSTVFNKKLKKTLKRIDTMRSAKNLELLPTSQSQ